MNKKGIKSISTPNKKFEKILEKNFITLKINEFRTSIIHNKTEKKCENYVNKYNENKTNIKSLYSLEKLKDKNIKRYNKVKSIVIKQDFWKNPKSCFISYNTKK